LAASGAAAKAAPPDALPVSAVPLTIDQAFERNAWPDALVLAHFYEILPHDNTPAAVQTRARIIRDDRALFATIWMEDPDPRQLRAPLVERDQVTAEQDLVQLEVDAVGDGRSSRLFRVNPRNVQADGVYVESTGLDDFSPDFAFESETRIVADGWMAVFRVPLSSLPFRQTATTASWHIVIYRNFPRHDRFQFASNRIPRGSTCWLCHARSVSVSPFGHRREISFTPHVVAGTSAPRPERESPAYASVGADVKVRPSSAVTADFTWKPDFSQVESDVIQLTANSRFALQYPEKRPFFLEARDLFATPIAAVYTRTVTAPLWGARVTGQFGQNAGAVLVAADSGGGAVVIPGSTASEFAPQDFSSLVLASRLRRSTGPVTFGGLLTGRTIDGGGSNWVIGPDIDWRPNKVDQVLIEHLVSLSRQPVRPELYHGWNGDTLTGDATLLKWTHSTSKLSSSLSYRDSSPGFRTDVGFVPQVNLRAFDANVTYGFYPSNTLNAVVPGFVASRAVDYDGAPLGRTVAPTLTLSGKWATTVTLEVHPRELTRVDGVVLSPTFTTVAVTSQPSLVIPRVSLITRYGENIDAIGGRLGRGTEFSGELLLRLTPNVGFEVHGQYQSLDRASAGKPRLFDAEALWIKATYAFSARMHIRAIAQYERTSRNASQYEPPVTLQEGSLASSALFVYRLGWRSAVYAGYGMSSSIDDDHRAAEQGRQVFLKVAVEISRR